MFERFKEHIEQKLPKEKKLLLGCSGGLDSVVLAHILFELGYNFALVHCNFSLRGNESDEDEAFVDELAGSYEVPFYAERFDTEAYAENHDLSIQMAARALRYSWFEELRTDFKYDYILTAHHADDNLETFFINLSRGTGLRGLTGIPEATETIIRPLLPFSREEILSYAKKRELYWREDSSNLKTDYLRNKIRLEVIPPYKEASNNALQTFDSTQQNLKESSNLIDDYMSLVFNLVVTEFTDGYSINIPKLKDLPNSKTLLYELLYTFGFTAWEDITGLLTAQSGKQVLSKTHRVVKDRELLLVSALPDEEEDQSYEIQNDITEIQEPIHLAFEQADWYEITNAHTVFVDADRLTYPLELRKWKAGDSFRPFGMQGKKKLSKFFKDEKLSLVAKEKVWVLRSNDDIVWVVGHRLDDRFKVEKQTENILRITFIPNNT